MTEQTAAEAPPQVVGDPNLLARIMDSNSRPDPYPLYEELRQTPVLRAADGSFVFGRYRDVTALLHDPRLSSDLSKRAGGVSIAAGAQAVAFIGTDPPVHEQLRRTANRPFGPPTTRDRIAALEPELRRKVDGYLDAVDGSGRFDLVDSVAYPFPVSVICQLLGVPEADEPKFHGWSLDLINGLGAQFRPDPQTVIPAALAAREQLRDYLTDLVARHRATPGDDLISGMILDTAGHDGLTDPELIATAVLLLIAGHETTVNLIANGVLTLLRHPEHWERLRAEPAYSVNVVEELLRFEPPVQLISNRTPIADMQYAGVTIPAGSSIVLGVAAASRDPAFTMAPNVFDPDRQDRTEIGLGHLGFGSGIHYCFGAPLARLEVQIALATLARRLVNPRLVADPPPYRPSPVLRGPIHLPLEVDGIRD